MTARQAGILMAPALIRRWMAAAWRSNAGRMMRNPWLLQAAFAASLLGLAFWRVNLADVAGSFRGVRYEWFIIALLAYVAARTINAWEWQKLLTKVGKAPVLGLLGALFIGTLVNAVAPANLGDVARMQVVANRYALPRAGLVAGRGSEALLNAFMFTGVVMLSFLVTRSTSFQQSPLVLVLVALACLLLFAGAIVASRALPATVPSLRWRRLPARVRAGLQEQWPRIHDGFEVMRRPRLMVTLIVVNLFGWGIDLLINGAYGSAFNLNVPLGAYLSVTVALAVITTMPITFGNIGTWEVTLVSVLGLYGVPPDRALAYAIGSHVVVTVFNIALGLGAMGLMRIGPGEVFGVRRTSAGDGAAAGAPVQPSLREAGGG